MKSKLCAVCNNSAPKYKCPTCKVEYCSAKCFKDHKSMCIPPVQNTSQIPANSMSVSKESEEDDEEEEQHRLKEVDLQKLAKSDRVQQMLAYPEMRALMETVCSNSNPVQVVHALRQRPDFEQLVQAMLEATTE
ncbi:Zinc finger HIT domain-containing protein 3 [Coemansia brasiliensis]|uniref:Zinc finger HIT domain-containing protein 3 n=1 Tax=Coemansia brasiliensis TaxID=2650707 RepID=A0A9W8M1J2_9FUNG|nr:Zinc finger HIT domain-containing protein 3 [Coemansia brasiliensis]